MKDWWRKQPKQVRYGIGAVLVLIVMVLIFHAANPGP